MMSRKLFQTSVAVLALTVAEGRSEPDLSLGSANGFSGGVVVIPVNFLSGQGAAALQFDVIFDPAIVSSGAASGGDALFNHQIASSTPANGTRRVLIYSLANALLTNGVLVHVPFTISQGAPEIAITLSVTNLIIADASAAIVQPESVSNGSISIVTPVAAELEEITRLSDGRLQFSLNGSPRGQYVIQASDDLRRWASLSTNSVAGGPILFTDSAAGGLSQRFYRATHIP